MSPGRAYRAGDPPFSASPTRGGVSLKTYSRYLPFLILLLFVLAACGYHNPNVYTGPDRVIYLAEWKNRTSELGLDARFYQTLLRWYQKSGSISVTKDKDTAQLILAGEIVSISLPSRAYDATNSASEVKVNLRVRYVLKDLATGQILVEEPGQVWSESYVVGSSASESKTNQRKAIDTIIDDISERIYQKTLMQLQK